MTDKEKIIKEAKERNQKKIKTSFNDIIPVFAKFSKLYDELFTNIYDRAFEQGRKEMVEKVRLQWSIRCNKHYERFADCICNGCVEWHRFMDSLLQGQGK